MLKFICDLTLTCLWAQWQVGASPIVSTVSVGDHLSEDLLPPGQSLDYRWTVYRWLGDIVSLDPQLLLKCHNRMTSGCQSLRIHCRNQAFSSRDIIHRGGWQTWPTPDTDQCWMDPGAGVATKCAMNSTISTQPHLADYTSIDVAMMNAVDREGVVPDRTEFARRCALAEEAFREVNVKLQGKNILPFSLQHQTFLLAVLADMVNEFFWWEQYSRLASAKEDYVSSTVTVELVFNRGPETVTLKKQLDILQNENLSLEMTTAPDQLLYDVLKAVQGIEHARHYLERRFAQQQMPVNITWVSSQPLPGESPKDQFSAIVGQKYMRQHFSKGIPWHLNSKDAFTIAAAIVALVYWVWSARRQKQNTAVLFGQTIGSNPVESSLQELSELRRPDGKLQIDLIAEAGVTPLTVQICKRPDGSDWLLGVGGYAKVYKAVTSSGQEVAVKVLHNASKTRLSMFAKEARVLESVGAHPAIVQLHGACLQDNTAMLVLEYMQGGDLHEALMQHDGSKARQESITWYNRGAKIALDVAQGLQYLHGRKVVHRDIKSKNILLTKDGQNAKIADVGLSRVLDSLSFSSANIAYGTFAYAAPEVLLGYACTEKVDMYSYGVLLWEIVTQEVPSRGQLRDFKVPEECPQAVAELHEACLQQDPDLRPSVSEAILRLQQAI